MAFYLRIRPWVLSGGAIFDGLPNDVPAVSIVTHPLIPGSNTAIPRSASGTRVLKRRPRKKSPHPRLRTVWRALYSGRWVEYGAGIWPVGIRRNETDVSENR